MVVDHCRIGSLEKMSIYLCVGIIDHCRIGSLENKSNQLLNCCVDHCRIGSLEMDYYPDNRLAG